jgi:hypothetical protein
MAKYADLVHNILASCSIAAVNRNYKAAINAVSDGCHRYFSPRDQQQRPQRRNCEQTSSLQQDESEVNWLSH